MATSNLAFQRIELLRASGGIPQGPGVSHCVRMPRATQCFLTLNTDINILMRDVTAEPSGLMWHHL